MLSVAVTSFAYQDKEILSDINFQLKNGEHLAILGESGSGKSTLLHIIYGLLHLERGQLFWKDEPLLGPNHRLIPGEPFIKLVSQEFTGMPFTSVEDNIATHLSRLDPEEDAARILQLLEVVDLVPFRKTIVKNLSGGQKQRVALAKALAKEPELLLLDEPFSNIDSFRKNRLRRNLFAYLKENEIACITATHDSEEALSFADLVLILKGGSTASYGAPEEIYNSLTSAYQAGFFGEVSVLPIQLMSSEENGASRDEIVVLPHQLEVVSSPTQLKVRVKNSYFKGSHYLIQSHMESRDVFFNHSSGLDKDQIVYLQRKRI